MVCPPPSQAVAATRAAVLDTNADLGIMLDTDVDRSGVVDRSGNGGLGWLQVQRCNKWSLAGSGPTLWRWH